MEGELAADSTISRLVLNTQHIALGALPESLSLVFLDGLMSPDLSAFALSEIDELWLMQIGGNLDLTPLSARPPRRINLGYRFEFQSPAVVPDHMAERCEPGGYGSYKQFIVT